MQISTVFGEEKMATALPISWSEGLADSDRCVSSNESETAWRNGLIFGHMHSLRFIAKRIHARLPRHIDLQDLESAGLVGLVDAANKFDPSKEVQFKTYADFRIRGAILDSLRASDWSPRELRRQGRQIQELTTCLTKELGRTPSTFEIAERMGLSPARFQQLTVELKGTEVISLDAEISDDDPGSMLESLASNSESNPLDQCLQQELEVRLNGAVEMLPERERLVLTLYYRDELTLKEIGLILGVVESRVSQIRAAAIKNLEQKLDVIATPVRRPACSRSRKKS